MKYQQFTLQDRYILPTLRRQGISISEIAEERGKHRSTIYREINRNSCHIIDNSYRPSKAQRRTVARRRRSRRNMYFSDADFVLVKSLLLKKWSPENQPHSLMNLYKSPHL